jgi:cellulose biosynthesis protein BcsQ
MTTFRFDSALPNALKILRERFGDSPPETTLIRDALGKLVVALPDHALDDAAEWDGLAENLHKALEIYSPGSRRILLRHSDLVVPEDVLQSSDRVRLPDAPNTWLVDRLQTNQDWLREPLVTQPPLPTAVAYSIKGGVGRTTAFALWAWHLARRGKNIVLVDLDLEAPGVAGVLLDEDRMPDYGLADWLVEALIGQPDDLLLRDCLAECALSSGEPGRIRVLPAFGKKTRDYVNKLGRIYMPTFAAETGKFSGLAERLLMLLEQLSGLADRPDAVLLDARAGLHDIGSAAVTRLGAEVFLFARDDYQGWQAYQRLFEHLATARSVIWGMPDDDLRWRLGMVAAQAESTEAAKLRFIERSYETWLGFYDKEDESAVGVPQLFSREDDGPHQPAFIRFDPRVKFFDLIESEARPDWQAVEQAFGEFFPRAAVRLLPNDSAQENA